MILGKDVAGFIIHYEHDCNLNGGDEYVSLDVNTWILVGSACHLSIWIVTFLWLFIRFCCYTAGINWVGSDLFTKCGPICI